MIGERSAHGFQNMPHYVRIQSSQPDGTLQSCPLKYVGGDPQSDGIDSIEPETKSMAIGFWAGTMANISVTPTITSRCYERIKGADRPEHGGEAPCAGGPQWRRFPYSPNHGVSHVRGCADADSVSW